MKTVEVAIEVKRVPCAPFNSLTPEQQEKIVELKECDGLVDLDMYEEDDIRIMEKLRQLGCVALSYRLKGGVL